MPAQRRRLPNRRESEIVEFDLGGVAYRATLGRFDDGAPAELFLDGPKIGSAAQIAAHDAAVLASLALQYGVTADDMLHSLEQLRDGAPAGPVGVALASFAGQP